MSRRLPKNPTAFHCPTDTRHLFGTTVTPLRPNLPESGPRLYLQASQCVRGTCVAAHEVGRPVDLVGEPRHRTREGGTSWPRKIADSLQWIEANSARLPARAARQRIRRGPHTSGRVRRRATPAARAGSPAIVGA